MKQYLDEQNTILQVLVPGESWITACMQERESMETVLTTRMQHVIFPTIHILGAWSNQ